MALSRKTSAMIVIAVFVGVLAGLIIASNFEWTQDIIASDGGNESLAELEPAEPLPVQSSDTRDLARAINDLYVGVVDRVSPSVVTITSEKRVEMRSPFTDFFQGDDFFRRWFGFDTPQENEYIQNILGSGVIVRADGHILTNNHVIEGAEEVRVMIGNDEYNAEIVGTDPATDIGVLKIENDGKAFNTVEFGDSDALRIGEVVLAFGTPFDPGLDRTVTRGIVSAKSRGGLALQPNRYVNQNFIQTDAAINPGNSGGPLVNLNGELVGINTAIVGQANVGVGFAVPVNTAKWVMDQILEKGEVTRGWLGVLPKAIDQNLAKAYGLDETYGVLIEEVTEDSPAEKAGIKVEDIILKVNEVKIRDDNHLRLVIAGITPNTRVTLLLFRDGEELELELKLGERPADEVLAQSSSRSEPLSKLGMSVSNLTREYAERLDLDYESDKGVVITSVQRGSDAYREGIPSGGLIREVNRVKVENVRELEAEIEKVDPGEIILLRIKYNGRNSLFALEMPEN